MPNLLKKSAPSRKHEEKKTFVGIPQQSNALDHYLIKAPVLPVSPVSGKLANKGAANQRIVPPANLPPVQFHSNRFNGQEERKPVDRLLGNNVSAPANISKWAVGMGFAPQVHPVLVQSKSETERMRGYKGGPPLRFNDFAGNKPSTTTSESTNSSNTYRGRSNNSDDSSEESTTTKQDIVSYYKDRGLDYVEERKKCRQYVSRRPTEFSPITDNEKLTGGAVYWDEYSPPPGFTWEDLEGVPIPEDPIPESPKGNQISPCVLKAANIKLKEKTPVSTPPSSQNFRDIIQQLESFQTNRDMVMEERRKKKEQKRKQKKALNTDVEFNRSKEMELCSVENEVMAERSANDGEFPFPNDEDSFIQRATQLEERAVAVVVVDQDHNVSEMSIDAKSNSRILSPRNRDIGGNTPVTSGLSFRNKSKRRSHLKRPPSGRLDFSNELSGSPVKKSSTTTSPDSEESFNFEKSIVENTSKSETPKVIIGDFVDDDDDEMYSQVVMPIPNFPEQDAGISVPVDEKSTELVSANSSGAGVSAFEDDSLISDDVIAALDQLEKTEKAKATGGPSNVYTSTPMQCPNMSVPSPGLGSALRKSVRLNTNNLSAIKVVTTTPNVVNESKETKSASKSRLSRSYVRSRK